MCVTIGGSKFRETRKPLLHNANHEKRSLGADVMFRRNTRPVYMRLEFHVAAGRRLLLRNVRKLCFLHLKEICANNSRHKDIRYARQRKQ